MLELVLTVCSLVQGASCHTLRIPLKEHTQLTGCAIAAQIEGAKWVSRHPNYYVGRVTCASPRKSAGRRLKQPGDANIATKE